MTLRNFCSSCGERLESGAAFCANCGSTVSAGASSSDVSNANSVHDPKPGTYEQATSGSTDTQPRPETPSQQPVVLAYPSTLFGVKMSTGLDKEAESDPAEDDGKTGPAGRRVWVTLALIGAVMVVLILVIIVVQIVGPLGQQKSSNYIEEGRNVVGVYTTFGNIRLDATAEDVGCTPDAVSLSCEGLTSGAEWKADLYRNQSGVYRVADYNYKFDVPDSMSYNEIFQLFYKKLGPGRAGTRPGTDLDLIYFGDDNGWATANTTRYNGKVGVHVANKSAQDLHFRQVKQIELNAEHQTKSTETNEAPSAAEAATAFERYSMQDYVTCVSAAMTIHAACTSANETSTPGCIAAKYQVYTLYPHAMNSLIASGVSSTTERDAYMNNEVQKQQINNQTLTSDAQLQQALEKDSSCMKEHGYLAKYVPQ